MSLQQRSGFSCFWRNNISSVILMNCCFQISWVFGDNFEMHFKNLWNIQIVFLSFDSWSSNKNISHLFKVLCIFVSWLSNKSSLVTSLENSSSLLDYKFKLDCSLSQRYSVSFSSIITCFAILKKGKIWNYYNATILWLLL